MKTTITLFAAFLLAGCSITSYQRGDVRVISGQFFRQSEVGKIQAEDTRGTNGVIAYKLSIGSIKGSTEAEALGTVLGTALKAAK